MTIRTDLSDGWQLRLAGDDPRVPAAVRAALPIAATVPGAVHTDLLAAGLIPDPYLDRNELDLDWIGRADWVYEREFEYDPAAGDRAALLFEGLDTVATMSLNGTVVARTENMHRRYEIPIETVVRQGKNQLAVRFDSAWAFGEQERERVCRLPNQYPGPFNYVRKMACNFGWDWGPVLVTAGIWRPVKLLQHHGIRIRDVRPQVTIHSGLGVAAFDIATEGAGTVEVSLAGVTAHQEASGDRTTVEIRVDDPELWWPRGLGAQPLYEAVVRFGEDEWRARIGFRAVRLDTEPDAEGAPFTLYVNETPVPVRGANWIPDDCFPSRVTRTRLRERLTQAVDANVNLLRIWGGGVYESGDFYELCDELGILVWQDFLFACAAYPEDERLAREVDAEARDNVARLMPHPSLVLWNGNNENIWGYVDWDWQRSIGDRTWGLGYYLELLPHAVRDTDPTRPYWPGSPYSGTMDIHPNDDDHALTHIWDVWNTADYGVYRDYRPRFVAEFGWQAPPTWSTLVASVHDEPLTPTSPGMLHHQKAEDGNGKLARGLAPHFPEPANIEDWHFATQLNQARAISTGVEYFRSLRPRCSGAIVWQLNDCWPVTSWAAVDGYGRKKPMWYALRAAYAPTLLTIQPRTGGLRTAAVNDTMTPWHATLTVRRMSFDGVTLAEHQATIHAEPLGAWIEDLPESLTTPQDPACEFLVASTSDTRALWFFAADRELAYRPAELAFDVQRDGDDVTVTTQADTLIRDLSLFPDRVAPAAEADRCLVTLLPGEQYTFRITGVPRGREQEIARTARTANDLVLGSRALTP